MNSIDIYNNWLQKRSLNSGRRLNHSSAPEFLLPKRPSHLVHQSSTQLTILSLNKSIMLSFPSFLIQLYFSKLCSESILQNLGTFTNSPVVISLQCGMVEEILWACFFQLGSRDDLRQLKPNDFDSFIYLSNTSLWRDYPVSCLGHAIRTRL